MTETQSLMSDWEFRRLGGAPHGEEWRTVELPHSAFEADLDGRNHWFGECEYRRVLQADRAEPYTRHALYVGAAMHTANVLIDGQRVACHEGGYLPFEVDLTPSLRDGARHELLLRLDNRENPEVPPGKPYGDLDFCWYGGLYRDVEFRSYPAIHITDSISAGEAAGGGVFLRTLSADRMAATVHARIHVRNAGPSPRRIAVQVTFSRGGNTPVRGVSVLREMPAGEATHFEVVIPIASPALWSPGRPALYDVEVSVCDEVHDVLDRRRLRYGVRRIGFSRTEGFTVNGQPLRLRGTNRHQEYPRAGYAGPRAAQYRDARRIKEAGFDYVRLSHYPQSPDFLDACDELGIVVMNAIPGWQFVGGERFQAACVENARQLVRRDRNHACVALWELSLNETLMPEALMAELHAVGHEEYPGDQMFTCGWIDRYDVYVHSRQHGHIHNWQNGEKALVVAEYGDWEFYAANEGFDQTTGTGVLAEWANSRKLRGAGERGLRQQALNHLQALDDTLASPAVLDGQWAMFDYARGYHPERAACGLMDIFRLPKFSYYFYRSQRSPTEDGQGWTGGPVVFIASHWTPASDPRVWVFTNCDEIELRLNGRSFERQRPLATWQTQHLPHPPVVFDLPRFEAGNLEAVGWIAGEKAASHEVSTPGEAAALDLSIDHSGVESFRSEADLLTVPVRILDRAGTLCVDDTSEVTFSLEGNAELLGPATIDAEAGIAIAVVRLSARGGAWAIRATGTFAGVPLTAVWQSPCGCSVPQRGAHQR